MNIKTAVVWGAGGFIGSHLVKRLKKEGYWVRGVDLKYPEFSKTEADDFIIGDLQDINVCRISLNNNYQPIDELYVLAALMGGAGFIFTGDNDADIMHNSGQINLNAASLYKYYRKIFYSSSACIYPAYNQTDPSNPKCSEKSAYPAEPDSSYGWEKLFSENLYLAYKKNKNVDVKIARFHNIFGECFDDKTEVLTKNGWSFFNEITYNDDILTKTKNGVEFHKPLAIQKYHYDGMLYNINTQSINMCVTPDHQVYYSLNYKSIPKLDKIKNIWNKFSTFRFHRKIEWNYKENNNELFILNESKHIDGRLHYKNKEKSIKLDIWLEFLGWYLAEGCSFKTPTNYSVCITQYNNKTKKEIISCINKMGFSCYINENNIIISSKQLYDYCIQFGHSHEKFIPRMVLNLPKSKLKILFNSLMKGDGDTNKNRYSTNSKQLADDFQELVLKLGYAANISKDKWDQNLNHHEIYRVYFSYETINRISEEHKSLKEYHGNVYDVTVPNHIIYIRRNGKCCWSGNCGSWNNGKEKSPAAICRKVASVKDGDTIEIWGDGEQTRSYLYIDECLEGVRRLMASDFSGPVNIGSEEKISINNLVKMACSFENKTLNIKHIDGPLGVRGRNSDNKLIKEKLNWAPSQPLIIGLKRQYYWIKDQINIENKRKI